LPALDLPVGPAELAVFLRIDINSIDTFVAEQTCIAATAYVEQATGRMLTGPDAILDPRARLAVLTLAALYFENRGDTDATIPRHVQALIHQLTDWTKLGDPA
jgi:uncharacterized phage protein (predicted DNA packaging)